jgi:predicted AAA+ superfamily ATPase
MIDRNIEKLLLEYATQFRSLVVLGPRQSGKSTLVKKVFHNKPYVSLENPDERLLAETDPRAFLNRFPGGAILDEVQRTPHLFSYLQQIIDDANEDGLFILTGSNNFMLQNNISQSLAGRVGILDLLPLTIDEIERFDGGLMTLNDHIFHGTYPEIFDKKRKPNLWYPSYIRTYVERDVRLIKNIEDTLLFTKFLRICAGRLGQLVNTSALSNACGIDNRTVNSWLSVLESSYVIKLLPPFYNSFNKRVVKSPKLYFYDTGLACSLLNIKDTGELAFSHFRGALVENFIIMELARKIANIGSTDSLYFWRDSNQVEVDLIIDKGASIIPVEIKSSSTFNTDFLKGIQKFNAYSEAPSGWVVYDGEMEFTSKEGIVVKNWRNL